MIPYPAAWLNATTHQMDVPYREEWTETPWCWIVVTMSTC
jgi:hypothetical protein